MFSINGPSSPIQILIPSIVLLICLSFWGWMFSDMIGNRDLSTSAKENWTFAFILFNVFTAVVYYNIVYRGRR